MEPGVVYESDDGLFRLNLWGKVYTVLHHCPELAQSDRWIMMRYEDDWRCDYCSKEPDDHFKNLCMLVMAW